MDDGIILTNEERLRFYAGLFEEHADENDGAAEEFERDHELVSIYGQEWVTTQVTECRRKADNFRRLALLTRSKLSS